MPSAPPATQEGGNAGARIRERVRDVFANAAQWPRPPPRANQFIVYALGASIAVHAAPPAIRFRPFDSTRLRIAHRRSKSRW